MSSANSVVSDNPLFASPDFVMDTPEQDPELLRIVNKLEGLSKMAKVLKRQVDPPKPQGSSLRLSLTSSKDTKVAEGSTSAQIMSLVDALIMMMKESVEAQSYQYLAVKEEVYHYISSCMVKMNNERRLSDSSMRSLPLEHLRESTRPIEMPPRRIVRKVRSKRDATDAELTTSPNPADDSYNIL